MLHYDTIENDIPSFNPNLVVEKNNLDNQFPVKTHYYSARGQINDYIMQKENQIKLQLLNASDVYTQ